MMATHHIQTFCLGDWMTNCYVVQAGDLCWIVDAGFSPQSLIQYIQDRGLTPQAVVLTHAHVDHIAGLNDVRDVWPDLPIWIHQAEKDFLMDTALNLSIALAEPVVAPEANAVLTHGQVLTLADMDFEIRHTPGHSPGGICLYQAQHQVALVGDTLFSGSIGRYDFPTSDGRVLLESIQQQLLTLPNETQVLPGHGPATTIGQERQNNPFLM